MHSCLIHIRRALSETPPCLRDESCVQFARLLTGKAIAPHSRQSRYQTGARYQTLIGIEKRKNPCLLCLLAAHGIDTERVITLGPRDHRLLPMLYHNTDVGLFPNRVEGGNNMVLMEYMACGKPVIASYNSGHTDIVRRNNALLIECHKPMERRIGNELIAIWSDPSLEETIDKLEWAYQHRKELQVLAQEAAQDMRRFSWHALSNSLREFVL